MREKNRKPIASYIKLPQFTTMNVIDGQAGVIIYSSLICYSLTIDNILNIIVLLILAGVTIATLTGDNGLLTKAGNAKNTSTEAEVLEKLKLAYEDYYLGQHTEEGYTFQNALDKMFGEGVATASGPDSNGVYTVSVNRKTYAFNSVTGTAGEYKPGIGDLVTKDNYGDYIDLGQDVLGDSDSANDWRILYNDKAGHVYAILADYLPNSNDAVTASGLNAVSGKTYNVNSTTSRDDLLNKFNSTTAWQALIPEGLGSKCQVTGATTGNIILASYNEKYNINPEKTLSSSTYFYTIGNDGVPGSPDTLYDPHPGTSAYFNCYGYWLASPLDNDTDRVWFVQNKGNLSGSNWYGGGGAVRPVVSLPSNIQVTKNGNVWTVTPQQ